ncbi:uncharacterized protein L3040_002164 [Drepanopeziza brunnea f. sp. 'multigermtubi']|uniref:uncharacterized protein n=1 Tax=Drepanopeziza brunnea f. sp. 'multigermtubi' TaxID=698441 RepID=UPI0023A1E2D2|nr:hypothetical protein L3040_002164 [Drepanopeziza brunnea f. sp. 'multigermtubi']
MLASRNPFVITVVIGGKRESYLSQHSHKKLRKPGVRLRNRRRAIAGWSRYTTRYTTRYEAIACYETIPGRPHTQNGNCIRSAIDLRPGLRLRLLSLHNTRLLYTREVKEQSRWGNLNPSSLKSNSANCNDPHISTRRSCNNGIRAF